MTYKVFFTEMAHNSNCNGRTLDYNKEVDRLETYNDWNNTFIDKHILAKIGFYYLNVDDKVKCNFCKIIVKRWIEGDNPVEEHMKWSSSCPFMRRRTTRNIPINEEELDAILPPQFSDVCGHDPENNNNEEIKYPEYRYEIQRLDSFKSWPLALKQRPTDFVDSGLFYTGHGDRVVCFCCGLGLKNWDPDDKPIIEHAKYTSGCQYLDHIKGERFVQDVKNEFAKKEEAVTNGSTSQIEVEEIADDTKNKCVVCYENDKEFVFIPCGHMATCAKCSFSMNVCPICRSNITAKQRVYNP